MSWSLESTFVRSYAKAAVGVQVVLDALKKAEELTRPPRRNGFDEDAAGEFLGRSYYGPYDEPDFDDDTPNPTEPGLTDDELIGVRGLLQERYNGPLHERAKLCLCPSCRTTKSSAPVKSTPGTGAGTSPSPTINQSAPPPSVDGEGPLPDSAIPRAPGRGHQRDDEIGGGPW